MFQLTKKLLFSHFNFVSSSPSLLVSLDSLPEPSARDLEELPPANCETPDDPLAAPSETDAPEVAELVEQLLLCMEAGTLVVVTFLIVHGL